MKQEGTDSLRLAHTALVPLLVLTVLLPYFLWPQQAFSSSQATASHAVNASFGLRLDISVSAVSVDGGEGVRIDVSVKNILHSSNTVPAAKSWKVRVTDYCLRHFPLGVSVFAGDYDVNTVLSASPLNLSPDGVYHCPAGIYYISSYLFDPSSSNATVIGSCGVSPPADCFNWNLAYGFYISGYWTSRNYIVYRENSFHSFDGIYTIVGVDEWGDIALTHFVANTQSEM